MQQNSRRNRLEALAYRINDWEDESLTSKQAITSTPEKGKQGFASSGKKSNNCTPTKSGWGPAAVTSGSKSKNKDVPCLMKEAEKLSSTPQVQASKDSKPVEPQLDRTVSPIKAVVLEKSILRCLV